MHIFRLLAVAASVTAIGLSSCATLDDAMGAASGMGVVSEEHSTFDGATILTVSAMPLWAKGSWGNAIRLGAHWTSAVPDMVALDMSYASNINSSASAFTQISGIDINTDGEITTWRANTPTQLANSSYNTISHTIYTASSNSVVIPYSLLQRMVAAADCRLRIHTGDGYEDAQFNLERIPGGQATAIVAIKKFMVKVDAARAAARR